MAPADPVGDVAREVAVGRALGRVTYWLNDADARAAGFEAQVNELGDLLTALAADINAEAARVGKQGKGAAPSSWLLAGDRRRATGWAWHPGVVEELWWLRQAHREAYAPTARSVAQAGDWHDRLRLGVVARLAVVARDCDLSRHTANGDRIQDPPVVPLAGEAKWIATHWVNGGTLLSTPDQLAQARVADQRHRQQPAANPHSEEDRMHDPRAQRVTLSGNEQ